MSRARERLEIDDAKKDPFDVLATRARRDDDATTRAPPNISRPEQSPLLGKLATFLPSLASANEALATKTASEVNIEVASDDDGAARIEMVRGDEGARAGRARRRRLPQWLEKHLPWNPTHDPRKTLTRK